MVSAPPRLLLPVPVTVITVPSPVTSRTAWLVRLPPSIMLPVTSTSPPFRLIRLPSTFPARSALASSTSRSPVMLPVLLRSMPPLSSALALPCTVPSMVVSAPALRVENTPVVSIVAPSAMSNVPPLFVVPPVTVVVPLFKSKSPLLAISPAAKSEPMVAVPVGRLVSVPETFAVAPSTVKSLVLVTSPVMVPDRLSVPAFSST